MKSNKQTKEIIVKTKPILGLTLLALLGGSSTASALTMETVTVGNPGNPNDSTGYGAVSYTYNIGKYEVTLNQYTEFLNAVADTNSMLYLEAPQ